MPSSSGASLVFARPRLQPRPIVRTVLGDLLVGAILGLLVLGGTVLGYRQPLRYDLPIEGNHGLPVDGLGEPEQGEGGVHRWTSPFTRIRFPAAGSAPYRVTLDFHNPLTEEPRTLSVGVGARTLTAFAARPGWQQVTFEVPAAAIDPASGELDLLLLTSPPFKAGGRDLGVALRSLQVRQLAAAGPPVSMQWALALCMLLIVVPLRLLGGTARSVGAGSAALLMIGLLMLVRDRLALALVLPLLNQALAISLLVLPLLWIWVRCQPPAARPWAIGAAAVAVGLFVARFAGMRHPQFVQIDHTLRIHQIEAIALGQRARVQAQLSQQYEWGRDVAIPYSLLSYDLFVPLAGRLPTGRLLSVVEAIVAALDASVVPLLWSIARRNRMDAVSSWWAAALFAAFPVGYLYFHDGSYPTIIGLWMTVVVLWLSTIAIERPRPWLWAATAAAVSLSILMYVTHLAFVPALLGSAAASALVLGVGPLRSRARWVAAAGAVGLLLAFLGYYGAHLGELITKTIPQYLATLSREGNVGRDPSLLPGPLLGNTWQQLWGHYRVIGVVLALVGLVLALRQRERWSTHLVVGYGTFLLLTALADLRFGLWNKHMYFALPGICLAAASVLARLQRRGGAGRVVAWLLFGYLLWTSTGAWVLRVVWYEWSLKTL